MDRPRLNNCIECGDETGLSCENCSDPVCEDCAIDGWCPECDFENEDKRGRDSE